jgi:methionyl-tRNA formyltransferase
VAAGDRLLYGASGGALELLELQPAGGRQMDAAAWLRGHRAELSRSAAGGTIPRGG